MFILVYLDRWPVTVEMDGARKQPLPSQRLEAPIQISYHFSSGWLRWCGAGVISCKQNNISIHITDLSHTNQQAYGCKEQVHALLKCETCSSYSTA